MRYIAKRRARFDSISGPVNLRYGTPVVCRDGLLISQGGRPICRDTSQNAYDYFARDDDGQGLARGRMIAEIQAALAKDPSRWDALWAEERCGRFRRKEHEDFWVWSYDFFNASISELATILSLCKEVNA